MLGHENEATRSISEVTLWVSTFWALMETTVISTAASIGAASNLMSIVFVISCNGDANDAGSIEGNGEVTVGAGLVRTEVNVTN